jgi:hypothetical protein
MMKLCWARQLEVVAHAIVKELDKDEPDWAAVAVLIKDVKLHAVNLENRLQNEGVILVE